MSNRSDHELDRQLAEFEERVRPLVQAASPAKPMRAEFRADLARELRATTPRPVVSGAGPRLRWGWPRFSPARVGGVLSLVASLIVAGSIAYPQMAANADASALVSQVQDATEAVPVGQVRHVVTTFTGYPEANGSGTLDQWFGSVGGRDVTRQIGPGGDVTVVDPSDTLWIELPGGNHVIEMLHVSGRFPMPTPNRVALNGVGARSAQPRVTGHTSVHGRPATELEFVQRLPTHVDRPTAVFRPGTAGGQRAGRKHPVTLIVDDGGPAVLFVEMLAGGSVVTDVVVDDASHQILRGAEVTKDKAGTAVNTLRWEVTTDELVSAAQVPPELFTFIVPAGVRVDVQDAPPEGSGTWIMRQVNAP
jgi:hypothetical protein